jgi:hypothetical protein
VSREEDDAVALVRVYCGLASAQPSEAPASAGVELTAAVVDDAGRLLDVCEISDDPSGYARLTSLLVERSNGSTGVAIAADDDQRLVTALFTTAGRPLTFPDEEAVDDYAERFADDESAEEIHAPQVERRAVGLARALQAGALSAATLPVPRDLLGYKPVLAAHAALINGRQAAAVALREILRELYPAALRAYPDPAEPVSLAVLDALPEPGMLNGSTLRGRDTNSTDMVAARLADEGIADMATLTEAVTALRVAVSETPKRSGAGKALTAAVAETIRQAVAAVRACDAACATLVGALTGRVSASAAAPPRRATRRARTETPAAPAVPAMPALPPLPPAPAAMPPAPPSAERPPARVPTAPPRRARPVPAAQVGPPPAPQPMAPPPVAPPPVTPRPAAPAAGLGPTPHSPPPGMRIPTPPPLRRQPGDPRVSPASAPPAASAGPPQRYETPPISRPVSAPPPPPPGITPIVPSQRSTMPPADSGEPFRAPLTAAAINTARAELQQRAAEARRQPESGVDGPAPAGINAVDVSLPMPMSRPAAEPATPGSRANWPLLNSAEDRSSAPAARGYAQYGDAPAVHRDRQGDSGAKDAGGRVTPPWQADDLPPEPPMLRLVEPPADPPARPGLPPDPLAGDPLTPGPLDRNEPPPLRLVEGENGRNGSRGGIEDIPAGPVSGGDDDLLIFAATRSAWFIGHDDRDASVDWSSSADAGWRAAEQAAQPTVGAETRAGLPKRVPQANLVPGSPLRDERPLRIVRDPASIAAHTTGYFRGWRRGQEIGGYAVGGRPGRESAGGWDFSRDDEEPEDGREYEYRSAGYRS